MSISTISTSYVYPQKNNQGGVKAVYFGPFDPATNGTSMTFGFSGSQIFTISGATAFGFIRFSQRQGQASLANTFVPSKEKGTSYYTQTVELILEQPDSVLLNTINVLAQGLWRIMVLDQIGNYWMVGQTNGADCTVGSGGAHKAYGDGSEYTLTFTAMEPLPSASVAAAAALSVITN